MGMETLVHFHLGDARDCCARFEPTVHVEPNVPITLTVDMNNMHLLDEATGKVL